MKISSIIRTSLFCIFILLIMGCRNDKTEEVTIEEAGYTEELLPDRRANEKSEEDKSSRSEMIDPNKLNFDLLETLVHEKINEERSIKGLNILQYNPILTEAASDQNDYITSSGKLSHNQSSGNKRDLSDRLQFYGGSFQMAGENVLYEGFMVRTYSDRRQEIVTTTYDDLATRMVISWMNSPGHRRNILTNEFDLVGTAVNYNREMKAVFATQVFGKDFN